MANMEFVKRHLAPGYFLTHACCLPGRKGLCLMVVFLKGFTLEEFVLVFPYISFGMFPADDYVTK